MTVRKIVVVIPTLNNQGTIAKAIDGIPRKELVGRGYEVHIVVMDGRSSDGTTSIARSKGAHTLVQRGTGRGAAVRQAFALCDPRQVVPRVLELSGGLCSRFHDLAAMLDSDHIILIDAQGLYQPRDILRTLTALQDGADVVMGSRFMDGETMRGVPFFDRARNILISSAATLLYQRRCTDLCSPVWGFSGRSLRKLRLDSMHLGLEAELFAEAMRKGLIIREIPLHQGRESTGEGKFAFNAGLAIVLKLIEGRFKDLRKRPAGPMRVKTMPVREPYVDLASMGEPVLISMADQVPEPGEMT